MAPAATSRTYRFALALCLILVAAFMLPATAHAQDSEDSGKTVRVGWYESSFNNTDQSGRRSGYAYEYQLKIAAYTGWSYEYVNGSWSELMQMLEAGEIDLLSDVSYTPDREERMLFPSLPMGTEEYCLFSSLNNQEAFQNDYSNLNGKKVGANKGSIQVGFFNDWAQKHNVQAEIIELTCSEDESLEMLNRGELDAFVTVDSFTDPERAVPVCKVGSSDFYFAVNKNRPDLLNDLNNALSQLQDEDRFYNEQMFEKFFKQSGASAFLSSDELKWLASHGTIRVGYQDNYLAFCATDMATGELTGAMKDYLDYASDCLANADLDFEAKAYPTASAALEALDNGEVDCVFPANLSGYDGEKLGVVMTPALMNADIFAVVRQSDQTIFTNRKHVIVAVNEGNPNYDAFLLDHFPTWKKVYYPTTDECLKAVSSGVADCVLISSYRYNNISRLCKSYRLTTLATGVGLDYCFAVANGNTELYSILSKVVGQVPSSTMNSALSHYTTEDAKLTFTDFIMDNLFAVITVIAIILLVILALMVRSMRAERKANKLIAATEADGLTGLYNRDFFFQYADRMFREHPDTPMDAIVLNIERFHSVNAVNGWEFGDQVLRVLGSEVRSVAADAGGIAGRFGADRFDIYCKPLGDYREVFDRLQGKLDDLSPSASIRLRMGVMPWQEGLEPIQLFDRARTACNMARGHYQEHLVVFDEKVREREIYEQLMLNDLRRALEQYEFEVYYQPMFDIQPEAPKLVGAEALVRWRHPELGIIKPNDFIGLFEDNGQIGAVDKYVWAEAAKQITRWREQFGVELPVAVNLSRVDVFDPELEHTLDEILSHYGLGHNALKLEVTESAYTESADTVIQVVEDLRDKGYLVGMDDFGTGYSSLSMLSAMPVDFLKMDQTFIRRVGKSEKDTQLVALILNTAENLKMPVIAEGVEVAEQLTILKDLGCALVQGHYFSPALHAADFEATYILTMQTEQ